MTKRIPHSVVVIPDILHLNVSSVAKALNLLTFDSAESLWDRKLGSSFRERLVEPRKFLAGYSKATVRLQNEFHKNYIVNGILETGTHARTG